MIDLSQVGTGPVVQADQRKRCERILIIHQKIREERWAPRQGETKGAPAISIFNYPVTSDELGWKCILAILEGKRPLEDPSQWTSNGASMQQVPGTAHPVITARRTVSWQNAPYNNASAYRDAVAYAKARGLTVPERQDQVVAGGPPDDSAAIQEENAPATEVKF